MKRIGNALLHSFTFFVQGHLGQRFTSKVVSIFLISQLKSSSLADSSDCVGFFNSSRLMRSFCCRILPAISPLSPVVHILVRLKGWK